jgi:hypothetical protein
MLSVIAIIVTSIERVEWHSDNIKCRYHCCSQRSRYKLENSLKLERYIRYPRYGDQH